MSTVLLVALKNREAKIVSAHYREILKQLNENMFNGKRYSLDSGYIIVDYHTSTIISNQSALSPRHIRNSVLKRFSWIVL